jgi:hypothetical protein
MNLDLGGKVALVTAGAEGASRAGNDDHPRPAPFAEVLEPTGQLIDERIRQSVQRVGSIEGQGRDAVGNLNETWSVTRDALHLAREYWGHDRPGSGRVSRRKRGASRRRDRSWQMVIPAPARGTSRLLPHL